LKVSVPDLDDSSFAPLFCTTPSAASHAPYPRSPVATRRPRCPLFPEWPLAAVECLLPSRSLTLLPCEHPSCAPLIAHVQPCAHPNCACTIATLNHSWHTRCRVRFETRLLSAVKLTQHVRTRCGSSLSPLIDIVQPSPAAGRGWHVLHTTTTCGAISDGSAPATHVSPRAPPPGIFRLFAIGELVGYKPCAILAASWWVSGDG